MAKGNNPMKKSYYSDCDAHTLAEAKAITKDPKRYAAAVKAAGSMANEQMDRAKAMKQVAGKKVK
jgi:hypothetical protein